MPGAAVRVVDGSSITANTSSFTAELTSISMSGISRAAIDTTHLTTTAPSTGEFGGKTFQPSDFADGGTLNISGHFDPDDVPPVNQPAEVWDIDFDIEGSDSTATSWSFTGFMTDFNPSGEMEGKWTFDATIKVSGVITRTAAT